MVESGALYELRVTYGIGSGASECHIYPKGQTWHVCGLNGYNEYDEAVFTLKHCDIYNANMSAAGVGKTVMVGFDIRADWICNVFMSI